MRYFISFFIILFSIPILADDIFDFTIEKYEINKSLKDYFTEREIENVYTNTYPGSDKFYEYNFIVDGSKYYQISFSIKKNDPQYLIYAVAGIKLYDEDINGCLKEKEYQLKQIDNLISTDKKESYTYQYSELGDGNNYSYVTDYVLSSGRIRLYCDEYSRVTKSKQNLKDSFSIDISTNEYIDFIDNEAYQVKKDLSF